MKAKYEPNAEFFRACDEAIEYWQVMEKQATADLAKAYRNMKKRCGFLWLKKRTVTEEEARKLYCASARCMSDSFDHAWYEIWRYQGYTKAAKAVKAFAKTLPKELYLSEHETSVIFALED